MIWPRKNGGFRNTVFGRNKHSAAKGQGWMGCLTCTEVEVAQPLLIGGQLGRIQTLSKKTQDMDICQFSL